MMALETVCPPDRFFSSSCREHTMANHKTLVTRTLGLQRCATRALNPYPLSPAPAGGMGNPKFSASCPRLNLFLDAFGPLSEENSYTHSTGDEAPKNKTILRALLSTPIPS